VIATNKTLGYDIDMQRVEQKLYVLLVCELIPPDGIERSNTTYIHSCTSRTGELLSVARSTSVADTLHMSMIQASVQACAADMCRPTWGRDHRKEIQLLEILTLNQHRII